MTCSKWHLYNALRCWLAAVYAFFFFLSRIRIIRNRSYSSNVTFWHFDVLSMYAISQCSVARINLPMSSSYRLDREAALLSVTTELCNQLVIAVAVATMTSADLHINYIVLPLPACFMQRFILFHCSAGSWYQRPGYEYWAILAAMCVVYKIIVCSQWVRSIKVFWKTSDGFHCWSTK